MLCIFNLSAQTQELDVTGLQADAEIAEISQNTTRIGDAMTVGPNGYAFISTPGTRRVGVHSTEAVE